MNKKITAAAVAALISMQSGAVLANAQDAQKEVDKQIAKLIADAIAVRVAASVAPAEDASSTSGSLGYTRINVEFAGFESSTDVILGSLDHKHSDDIMIGLSVNYASTDNGGSDTIGMSPYIAYLLNKNFFIKASLNHTRSDDFSSGANSFTSNSGSVGLNGLYMSEDQKLRLGGRFDINRSFNTDAGQPSWVAAGNVRYAFMDDIAVTGELSTNGHFDKDPEVNPWQAGIGIEKTYGSDASISLSYSTVIDDDISGADVDVDVFSIVGRMAF